MPQSLKPFGKGPLKPLLILLFILLALASLAEAATQRFTLRNGLTVILTENNAAKVVALNLWVKTGSINESDEEAGISHVFEHMLFKGTDKRKVGQIAQEIEFMGGDINAFTSFDHTVYYIVLPSRYLEQGLDILADAGFNSSFDAGELDKEKEVVLEEWRRGQDRPGTRLGEKLFSTVFTVHPYRRPIIGYEQTIKSFTREQIVSYFRKWYRPANMVLVLVGDFRIEEVVPKIERTFGQVPASPGPSSVEIAEPSQREMKAFTIKEEAKEARVELAFRIPSVADPGVPALDLLATVLGQGESSRLYRRVKDEKGLVHSVSADSFTPRGPGLFSVDAALEPGNIEKGVKELLKETFRLKYETIPDGEIAKAKLQILSTAIYGKETMNGEARKLGYYEATLGDYRKEEEYLAAVERASAQELKEVASKYLAPSNLTAGILIPQESKVEVKAELLYALAREAETEVEDASRAQERMEKGIVRRVLKNGITLLIKENPAVPIVAVRAVFLGGTRFESRDNNGINNMLAQMLTRGTTSRDAEKIAREVESMAGSLSGFSGQNSLGVSGQFLSRYFEPGLELLADVILNPVFPDEELEKVKKDVLAAIKRREERLSRLAMYHFSQALYPNHPYGLDPLGTAESIRSIGQADLDRYKNRYMVPQNMVLAVVGDVKATETERLVDKIFSGFTGDSFVKPVLPAEEPPGAKREIRVQRKSQQTHIILGFLGTTLKSEDRYALELAVGVLSGQAGRLYMELRDRQPLAYSVYAFSREGLEPGSLAVVMATAPGKMKEALDGIKRELGKITQQEVSPEELKRAANNIAGSFEIQLQRNSALASTIAFNELYGLGYNYHESYPERILKVTAKEVLQAARKYIDLNRYTLVVLGPEQGT